jgi:hypothetical protein
MAALPFDCSLLDSVFISFSDELLNNVAEDDAHDFEDFFDKDTPTNLADDLLDALCKQVEILLENSSTDHQATRLPSIMRKLFCVCETDSSNGLPRLRNQAKMGRAFEETVLCGDTVVKIILRCDLLCFHPDCQGNDQDMICIAHAELQSVTIPAPPPDGVTSMPANLSAAITQPAPVPRNEFRHKLLPSDAKQLYDDHQDPNIIVPVSQLVEFIPTPDCKLHRKCFHQPSIAGEKVIVRNGSIRISPIVTTSLLLAFACGVNCFPAMAMLTESTLFHTNFLNKVTVAARVSNSMKIFPPTSLDVSSTGKTMSFVDFKIAPCFLPTPFLPIA